MPSTVFPIILILDGRKYYVLDSGDYLPVEEVRVGDWILVGFKFGSYGGRGEVSFNGTKLAIYESTHQWCNLGEDYVEKFVKKLGYDTK